MKRRTIPILLPGGTELIGITMVTGTDFGLDYKLYGQRCRADWIAC